MIVEIDTDLIWSFPLKEQKELLYKINLLIKMRENREKVAMTYVQKKRGWF